MLGIRGALYHLIGLLAERSRRECLIAEKPAISPWCMNAKRPQTNGWVLVSVTGRPSEATHVGENAAAPGHSREVAEVLFAPSRRDHPELSGVRTDLWHAPDDPDAVSVEGLLALPARKALVDERVLRLREQRRQPYRTTQIQDESAHALS